MQKNVIVLFSLVLASMSCVQPLRSEHSSVSNRATGDTVLSNLKPFYWLADDWVLLQNGEPSTSYESWQYVSDSLFRGMAFSINAAGDTSVSETIELTVRCGSTFYSPKVQSQNENRPVDFRLSGQYGMSWTFENQAHDFPTHIRYALVGYDTLQAQVYGAGKSIRYTYLRRPRIQRFELPGENSPVVMRKFWLLSYLSGPNRSQSKEEATQIQAGHMVHLSAIYHAGKSCVAGPTDGDSDVRGFVVYSTGTREEAAYLASLDPAVKAGRLTFRLESWWAMEGTVLK